MSDLSNSPTSPAITRPILISLAAVAILAVLAAFLAGGSPDPQRLTVAVAFFAFGMLAQSAYASIYLMEPTFAHRMSHAVGFSLWVTAFLMVLWWFEGTAFASGMLVLIAIMAGAIPLSFRTFVSDENSEVLVDRSTLARGTPALDELRWLLALGVFAAAALYTFLIAPTPNPLALAYWAIFGCALLAPTLDVEKPMWMLRLRDSALVAMAVICGLFLTATPV